MKRAVLLDVSAMMYRAFFANMHFRTKNEPTGAIYGFVNTLMSILKEFSPEYVVAGFDVKRSTLKRSEIYEEYKAHRESVPEDLLVQFSRVEQLLDCYNIKKFKIDGYEADDVLGALANKFASNGIETIVVTGDKDLSQILKENIKILLLGKADGGEKFKILSTDEDVEEYLGVKPNKIPDLFGLIGDSSDGIPGVRKVGSKKAIPLLERFENLEGIYDNIDKLSEISGIGKGIITNIVEDKKIAFLSRELATICQDVPLEFELESFKYSIEEKKLLSLFEELEFKALIKKMNLSNQDDEKNNNESLIPSLQEREILIIDTKEKLNVFIEKLSTEEKISLFCDDAGIIFALDKMDCFIPKDTYSEKNSINTLFSTTNNVFLKEDIQKIFDGYNGEIISFNLKTLFKEGLKPKKIGYDMMIAFHLLTSQTKGVLENLITYYTESTPKSYEELFKKEKVENIPPMEYVKYIREKVTPLRYIYAEVLEDLKDKNLLEVFLNNEMPLIEVLAKMESLGIEIDPEYFKDYGDELEKQLNIVQKNIFDIAGETFNINSPKQLAEILFFKLNLPPVKKTKTGLSTDEEVLEKLKNDGVEIASYLLEHRKLSKLKNTYIDSIPTLRDENNRVHTTFNQIGTTTGRLSSSEPNLQNIPVKTEEGMKIRQGFVAKKGCLLMGIDYSQIELRVLAQMSNDKNLIDAYSKNLDLHSLTARKVFEISEDKEITREQRNMAKVINFSIIYGKTAFGLSKELNITPKEAGDYIDRYFSQYPKVKEFEKNIIEFTEKNGYTETFFGRRRIIEGINSKNKNIKNQAERMAVNSVIQGTAAEIIKKVMVVVDNYIENNSGINLLLQVHDELIFEIDEKMIDIHKKNIEEIMKNCVKFENVPLEINTNIGLNWAETK